MDIVAWDDPKVCRGIEILQGKVEDHTQINALRAKPDEVAGDDDELRPSDKLRGKEDKASVKQAPPRKPCGLELGRRLLIVLKAPAEPGEKSSGSSGSASGPRSKGGKAQAVRVVDHGATQKEAVRRLFDAQVLLRSYEEQLQEKEREVKSLHFALKEKRTKQQQMRNEAENAEQVQQEEEKKETAQTVVNKAFYFDGADGKVIIPYWLRNDERSRLNVDRLKNQLIGLIQLKGERVEAIEISDALWEVGMQFALRWAGSPDDEVLKQNQAMKEKFMTIQKQAMQETAMLRQHIKRVEFKYRELQNNAKQLKAALQSAVGFANQLHRSLAALQAQPPQQVVHHWQPRGEVRNDRPLNPTAQAIVAGWMRSSSPPETSRVQEAPAPSSPGIQPPPQGVGAPSPSPQPPPPVAVQPSVDGARAAQAAQRAMEAAQRGQALLAEVSAMSPVPSQSGGYAQGPFAGGGAPASWGAAGGGGGQLAAAPAGGGAYAGGYGPGGGGGGYAGGFPGSPKTMGLPSLAGLGVTPATHYDYDQGLPSGPTFAETYAAFTGGQSTLSLAEDDHMGFNASKEELLEMDHEIFEPLNSFDNDVRELLIDAVNEKVRRILSLDPSKFQNGRLPFGLRPDKKTNAEEELENEIRRLLAKIVDVEEDRDRAKKEAEELRKMIEALMRRHGLTKEDLHGASLQRTNTTGPEAPAPPSPAGRGRLTVKPEHEPDDDDDKDEKKKHKQREEELLMKIHQLEDALTLKKKENEDLRRRIFALENPPKGPKRRGPGEGDSDEEEGGGKARKRLEATVQDLREQLRQGEQEMKDARERIKELERLLREAQAPVAQVQEAPPPAPIIQIDSHTARKTQELLQRLLLRAAKFLEVQASSKGQKAVEGILGLHPGEAPKSRRSATDDSLPEKALPGFEEWTGEVLKAFDAYKPRQATPDPAPVKPRKPVVQEPEEEVAPRAMKEESPREGKCYKKEHKDVEKRMKELQDEISRLLLTIDELRRRIEQLQAVPMDPDTAEEVRSIMAKVGLQEMIDAAGSGTKLRGVFERLYQDAIQRIQRYGMVRERVLLANKAYSAVLAAIGGAKPEASTAPGAVPDFERLNETTQAALRGMWYNTDHLFRRACEYAMTQGVEASLLRVQKDPIKETEVGDIDFNLGEDDLRPKMTGMTRFRSADRLPGRRGERPSKAGFAATPTAKRPVDTGPTSFTSYVAALREAQNAAAAAAAAEDLGTSMPMRRRADANTPDHPKTLKAACTVAGAGPVVAAPLASSKSLPALPKGRGVLQGMADGEVPASPLSFAASQAALVDTRVL